MAGKYWEDVNVGDKFITAGKTVTDAAMTVMVGLAGCTEPLFVDEEFAQKTQFKGRIAPGPLTMLMMLGAWQQMGLFSDTAAGLLGYDKVRFTAPLRPGDTITVELEIIDKRETAQPGRGLLKWRWTWKNQRGETVAEMESANLVKRHPSDRR